MNNLLIKTPFHDKLKKWLESLNYFSWKGEIKMKELKILAAIIATCVLTGLPFIPSNICLEPKEVPVVQKPVIQKAIPPSNVHPVIPAPDIKISETPTNLDKLINATLCVLYSYKGLVVLLCGILMATAYLLWDFRKVYQVEISHLLQDAMDDYFGENREKVRISIFVKAKWRKAFWYYIKNAFSEEMRRMLPSKSFSSTLAMFLFPCSDYLIIFDRIGNPNESIHSTLFRIPSIDKQVDGIIGLAWANTIPIQTVLPDIRTIKLEECNELADIKNDEERNKVEAYMNQGNIDTLSKLKSIHRWSVSFWACRLCDLNNKPWGAIVVDSSEKDIFDKVDTKELKKYADKIEVILRRNFRYID